MKNTNEDAKLQERTDLSAKFWKWIPSLAIAVALAALGGILITKQSEFASRALEARAVEDAWKDLAAESKQDLMDVPLVGDGIEKYVEDQASYSKAGGGLTPDSAFVILTQLGHMKSTDAHRALALSDRSGYVVVTADNTEAFTMGSRGEWPVQARTEDSKVMQLCTVQGQLIDPIVKCEH